MRYQACPAILIALTMLVASTAADARSPRIDLKRADRAAVQEARATMLAWADTYRPGAVTDDLDPGAHVYIVRYSLDPCERYMRTRASCDVTYFLNDGSGCDDTIMVSTTRRNRLRVASEGPLCDLDEDADAADAPPLTDTTDPVPPASDERGAPRSPGNCPRLARGRPAPHCTP